MNSKQGIAYLFPGQGSQKIGMLDAIIEEYPIVRSLFDKASVILNYDLLEIVQKGPENKLNLTTNTQPALLISSYAVFLIHEKLFNIRPIFMAGHSLGEYTALTCSGAISFEDAVFLVAKRAQYMQDAVAEGKGAMAAIIGLDREKVTEICKSLDGNVVAANFNSALQIVVSGERSAVEQVIRLAKESGAKLAKMLPVSVPSHSPLMMDAARQLANHIDNCDISTPKIPVISNVTGKPYSSANDIKEFLLRQLYEPVEWVNSVNYMSENGSTSFIECGPGNVLAGLNKRIVKELPVISGMEIDKVTEFLN